VLSQRPKALVLLERNEFALYAIHQELQELQELQAFLGFPRFCGQWLKQLSC
jgi:FlaA1/EpsC-like NDP-sugar epimerase